MMKARNTSSRPAQPSRSKAPRKRRDITREEDFVQATAQEFEREGMGVAPKE